MLRIYPGLAINRGDTSRRDFLHFGMGGMASLTLPRLLQAKEASVRIGRDRKETALILIWLDGGPSHIDTYDMKPEAPAEYRGFFRPIPTNVPGMDICELLPLQARVADRFSIVRSLNHDLNGHYDSCHYMLTGYHGATSKDPKPKFPSLGSIATKVRGSNADDMPPYVSIPVANSTGLRPGYFGGHYLGVTYNPFEVGSDHSQLNVRVDSLELPGGMTIDRLDDRWALTRQFDRLRRAVDRAGNMEALDQFQRQAYDMITSGAARKAFDLGREDAKVRDRYGRNTWGQSVLMARRVVEAGAMFVTCQFGVGGSGWDHHWNLELRLKKFLPKLDQAVSALVEDLADRGLLDRVMFLVVGEMGRSPRLNNGDGRGAPGRDHWGSAMSCLIGGGGLKIGQIVGATTSKGEVPLRSPVGPEDLAATIYHVLGIDPTLSFQNHAGRPVPILPKGSPIAELV